MECPEELLAGTDHRTLKKAGPRRKSQASGEPCPSPGVTAQNPSVASTWEQGMARGISQAGHVGIPWMTHLLFDRGQGRRSSGGIELGPLGLIRFRLGCESLEGWCIPWIFEG